MGLFDALIRRSERRKALADLARFDDHLLRDMGLTRTDVAQMSRGKHHRVVRGHE